MLRPESAAAIELQLRAAKVLILAPVFLPHRVACVVPWVAALVRRGEAFESLPVAKVRGDVDAAVGAVEHHHARGAGTSALMGSPSLKSHGNGAPGGGPGVGGTLV